MKVSVIIPIFNVEQHISKSLESVINQTLSDIEIICVNDGSTDNSLKILQDFATRDKRIVIIDKANEGVSVARNVGLEKANGKYIMFLDSDDFLELDACETAYNSITKHGTDIGIFQHKELENDLIIENTNNKLLTQYAKDPASADYTRFQVVIWNKIYKKSFLSDNNIRFPKGIKNAEDVIFNWSCVFYNPTYCYIDKSLYIYLVARKGSATANFADCIKNDFEAFKCIFNLPLFKQQPEQLQFEIVSRFCKGAIFYWNKYYKLYQRKILISDIKDFVAFLENNYEKTDLKKLKQYNKIKKIYLWTFTDSIFSIINMGTHKIITIFGFKVKIKLKRAKNK